MMINLELKQSQIMQELPELELLVLFGSRATGSYTPQSDWDLAIAFHSNHSLSFTDSLSLPHTLGTILHIDSDRIDLIHLNHCSPVLEYVIAQEGKVLYEIEPDLFLNFQLKAWKHFADTAYLRRYQDEYIRQTLEQL